MTRGKEKNNENTRTLPIANNNRTGQAGSGTGSCTVTVAYADQHLSDTHAYPHYGSGILRLPDELLFILFSYLDVKTLGRITQVCKHFKHLAEEDIAWLKIKPKLTVIEDCKVHRIFRYDRSPKDLCRLAYKWSKGSRREVQAVRFREKQLPWLQFDGEYLWGSYKNIIRCYKQRRDGSLQPVPQRTLRGHKKDVVRFVSKDNLIVSGARNGSILCHTWEGDLVLAMKQCHLSDVQAVDFHNDVIVSGSRDTSIKVWTMTPPGSDVLRHAISAHDRIWSLAYNPDGSSFASGTAGVNPSAPPLRIWDAERGEVLNVLGSHFRHGAGVLDIQYEDPHLLLSAGYDTIVRLWDTRLPCTQSVLEFEEPFDSTVFCVNSDRHNAILAGTSHHGMTRLWDKRMTAPVQVYYVQKISSPVFCLTFDPGHLYVALDQGIYMLDFESMR